MNKMFTVWASLAALIVAAPIGKAHATDTPKFADILDSNFESATRDMGWLITVAPNSNALLMTPAGRVAGAGNCR